MDRFFSKHKPELDEGHAITMISDSVDKAYEKYRTQKGDKYLRDLSQAYQMICDFFEAKGIDVNSFFEVNE